MGNAGRLLISRSHADFGCGSGYARLGDCKSAVFGNCSGDSSNLSARGIDLVTATTDRPSTAARLLADCTNYTLLGRDRFR